MMLQVTKAKVEGLSVKIPAWLLQHINNSRSLKFLLDCSFEKAIQYPQMYAKTLNNLATMHFRLGQFAHSQRVIVQ